MSLSIYRTIRGHTVHDYMEDCNVKVVGGEFFGQVAKILSVDKHNRMLLLKYNEHKRLHTIQEAIPIDAKGKPLHPYM